MTFLRTAATALAVTALAGCSGPLEPLDVQTQALPVGLILGQHAAVATAPFAPITLPPRPATQAVFHLAGPAPQGPGTPPAAVPLPAKPGPCPAFDPLAPIGIVGTGVSHAPVPTGYTYRSTIASVSGAAKQSFAGPTSWVVGKPSAPNAVGDYTYQVTTTVPVAAFTKTTTYEVVPTGVQAEGQQVPPGNVGGNPAGAAPTSGPTVASPEQPGIYLDGVQESSGSSFVPSSPIPLVQFPVQVGATFATSGTDGPDTVSFTSTVTRQTKVNACGTPVGVWEVQLTDGTESSQGQPAVSFTETLDFATEAGGLVVGDAYSSSGSQLPSGTVTLKESDTIDSPPKATG